MEERSAPIVPARDQPYNDPKSPKILTFYPTMEEFRDFEKYIDYMESRNAHLGGIAKVVPPAGWIPRKSGYGSIDDQVIQAPIFQEAKQTSNRGAYEVRNKETSAMTVRELRRYAEGRDMIYSFAEEMDEIERNFWKQLTINPPIYGADSSGTLFDLDQDIWNVSKLPSILNIIEIPVQGVNTPYLYFGMWRAFFGWHTEDMDLYSINYIHQGASKFWYGLSPHSGRRLERLAASLFPDSFKSCNAFLRHKTSMISHSVLKTSGIPFNRVMQNEGEFIVTFPHAYHAGFNCGLNVAESTNFATERWIEYGKYASICSCQEDNVKIDMSIFIERYRPTELAAWFDGSERGRHPEDERSSKRRPTSGPASYCEKKPIRRKCNNGTPKTPTKRSQTGQHSEENASDGEGSRQKRSHSESSESDLSSLSSMMPSSGKRSCASLTSLSRMDRTDEMIQREEKEAADRFQIPPPLDTTAFSMNGFCETVSERVCKGRRRQQTPPDSSPTPPRRPAPLLPSTTEHPTAKSVVATAPPTGDPTPSSTDEPVDLRKSTPFIPWIYAARDGTTT